MKHLPQTKTLLDHYARLVDGFFGAREMHKHSERELLNFIDEYENLKIKKRAYQIAFWIWFSLGNIFYFWH